MEAADVQALIVAVAFGALLAAWGTVHFHEGQPPEEIRFSVPQTRYFFALGAHVSGVLTVYVFLVLAIYGMALIARQKVPYLSCYRFPIPHGCTFEPLQDLHPNVLVWSALLAALFIRLAVPNVPILRRPFDRLRDLTHDWALFPLARQRLVSMFSMPAGRDNLDAELAEELARYGVARTWLSFLSRAAKQSLLEVYSLRLRLIALFDPAQALGAEQSSNAAMKFASRWALRRFGRARAAAFKDSETSFRRLFRRTALALLLVEEISDKVENEALRRSVSNFVAEESDDVRIRYRRLIADAALSCVPHREERSKFLKYFGYEVPTAPALPLHPWVIVFLVDFLLFLIPSLTIMFTGEDQDFPFTPLVLFPLIHAISQTVAITWAIYPKVVSNFARPSAYFRLYFRRPPLGSLPWQSYIVFGLASYVTGAVILLLFRLLVPMPYPVILPTLLSSLNFLLMTVGVSVLIDVRLQSRSVDFQRGRVREGFSLASIMLFNTLTFQFVMFYVLPKLGLVDPKTLLPHGIDPKYLWLIRGSFLVLSPGLGFIVGYFVPAAAAAFLQRAKVLRLPDPLDHWFDPRGQSEKRWDARLSPQV
jgi:hypothetical protein